MSVKRRTLLHAAAAAAALLACGGRAARRREPATVPIALLHLAPQAGAVAENRSALLHAIQVAAGAGARWILTPELCISGYSFSDRIGTDWIEPLPDAWVSTLQDCARDLGVTVFVGLPERDPTTGRLHNTLLAIGPTGQILGRHRKIRTIKGGSEAWSSPGDAVAPVVAPLLGPVGMLICADACDSSLATSLKEQGARLLISAANWAPGLYGPSGEWEECSAKSGLPMIVCNRTGAGRTLDFRASESVVVCRGERVLTLSSATPAVFLLQWDRLAEEPRSHTRMDL